MSDYTKTTNFTTKDTLPTGNAGKIVKGTEIDVEFAAISTAIATKANLASPTFTGAPLAPTATAATNSTQLATTAYADTAITNERTATATLTNKTLTSPAINSATITGGTITGLTTPLTVVQGGTGLSSTPANGALDIGNGTNFTRTTLTAGTNISVTNGAGTITIAGTGVTSVATGNGLSGGTITTTGTLVIACPTAGSVGSYAAVSTSSDAFANFTITFGDSIAAGTGRGQFQAGGFGDFNSSAGIKESNSLSGTWRYLGPTAQISSLSSFGGGLSAIACRIS